MSGRNETDERYREYTKKLLQGKPKIISDYFYSFGERTEMTRFHYVRNVLDFIDEWEKEERVVFNIKTVKKIRTIEINKYLSMKKESGVSGSSRRVIYSALKNFFKYLRVNGYIETNPCNDIEKPRRNDSHEITFMTSEEIKEVIQGIKEMKNVKSKKFVNRDMLIFGLGCGAGLRATSIAEIDISNIDFENKKLNIIAKGDTFMEIELSNDLIELIQVWLKEREKIVKGKTDALFISSYGKRLSYAALYQIVEKHTKNIGKHISPHKMRSSCATNLYEKTGDIYLVQETLGHKQISNTKRYTKVSGSKKAKAVEMLTSDFL